MVPLALTLVGWKPFWGHTIKPCHSIDDDNHECCAVNCTGTVNKYKFLKNIYPLTSRGRVSGTQNIDIVVFLFPRAAEGVNS